MTTQQIADNRAEPRSKAASAKPLFLLRLLMAGLLASGAAVQSSNLTQASPPYGLLKTYPNPAPAANEEFGNAVAWLPSGDQIVVAARSDRLGGASALGAAYVITATTGAISHVLTETAGAADDYFGFSVAVSGTRILIGDQLDDSGATNAGAAFLYSANAGSAIQSFHEPTPSAGDRFGTAVAVVSDTAVLVGAPTAASNNGRAYVCVIADGTCPTAIDSPDGGNFGLAVAALADKFAVAAPFVAPHGRVYVFTTSTASLYHTIDLTTTITGDNFGSALSVANGNLLIGAQNGGTSIINTPGVAYLYSPEGVLLQTFNNPDAADSTARFGAAVAADGNLALIGAPGAHGNEGRAYLFNATTGALIDTFQKDAPAANDYFGNAVAMLGEGFLIGAPGDSGGANGAGAVYRFGPLPPLPANLAGSSKTVNATSVWSGNLITYTLTLTNSGTLTANFALTDTLDANVSLVSAPGLTGSTTLTASGVLTGLAQMTYQVIVHTGPTFNGSIANVAKLSGDGTTRDLSAPLVAVTNRLLLPLVQR